MGTLKRQLTTRRDPTTGKPVRVKSRKWYCQFRDASGRWRQVPAYTDKAASLQLLAELERDAARGVYSIGTEHRDHARRPIGDHLDAYAASLRGKRRSGQHVARTIAICRQFFAAARIERLNQLSASALNRYLDELVADGAALSTRNNRLTAVKSFVRWCLDDGRLQVDPLRRCKRINDRRDRRHERRALSPAGFRRLRQHLLTAGKLRGVSAADRLAMYTLAYYAGLRRNEIRSLTRDDFRLEDRTPGIVVKAKHEKAGRGDFLPIPADVAKSLRGWMAMKAKARRLFSDQTRYAAELLADDLFAVKIAVKTGEGVIDFHSLRVSYVTNLALADVPLAVAQKLARHSTPTLTLNIYAKVRPQHAASAVALLPPLEVEE